MVELKVSPRAASALSMTKNVNVDYTELHNFDDTKEKIQRDLPSTFQAWPTQPKPLVLAQRERLLYTVLDVALITLPVCLLIKTGLCIYAFNRDGGWTGADIDQVSYMSQALIGFNAQLVTLFTIVFVTIISTFVKRYALWKAQSGAYVSDLEQLQGSVSLPSTLKMIWSLRSFGFKSILLVLVWSFYYLGSQAVKLEYRLTLSKEQHDMFALVQRSDAPSYFSPNLADTFQQSTYTFYDPKTQGFYLTRLNARFGAMILEDQDIQDQNLHGSQPNPGTNNGPLIPDYHYAVAQISQKGLTTRLMNAIGDWIDVSKQQPSSTAYVSLTGQSLWLDIVSHGNGTEEHDAEPSPFLGSYALYNISYLNVSCDSPIVHQTWSFPNGTLPNSLVSFNMTPLSPNATKDKNGHALRSFDYWYKIYLADPVAGPDPYSTDLNGTYNYTLRAVQTTCSLSTKYVDMKVNCIATGCYPYRLRWANETSEYNATGYSTPFDNDLFAANFLSNFTLSTGLQDNFDVPALVEQEFGSSYIVNGTLWSTLGPAKCLTCMSVDTVDVTENQGPRLTPGFNTYYTLSQSVLSDFIQPNITAILEAKTGGDEIFILVNAHGAPLEQGYRIYWQWIPVDFVACSILLAAAIGAYWLRINTLAPDIFGYVSSLTRDNPHIQLPSEGSALSGIDRARMLKGVKVKIGDVQNGNIGESSVGRVGLAPVNAEMRPLYSQAVYA